MTALRRGGALLLALALLAGACSSGDDAGGSAADTTAGAGAGGPEEGAFPVTVEHRYGETTIEGPAQRVVSVGFTDQDPLLALGVVPVGILDWYGDQPYGVWPWAQDLLGDARPEALASDTINFEAIAALRPDLIIGVSSGMTQEQYDRLSQIAPTVAQSARYPDYQGPWQEQTRTIGRAVGKPTLAEELVAEVEGDIAAAAAAHPELEGVEATMSFVLDEDEIGAYASGDSRSRLLTDLGMVIPARIDELAGDQFYASFSVEQMQLLDNDLIVWVTSEPAIIDQIKANGLRQQLRAVQEGREVFLTVEQAGAASFSSVLSLPYLLETFVPELAAAVDGDPATTATTAVTATTSTG
jgi:iron complex transport system substrate-binding protein